ncbi:hypothetical protein BX600DRAFT_387377 [Xylariales sp. PMI_506]|nr:hypothetical protein BX600DRAFT_387377 [Xylariales sp. PMI_506]
MALIATIFYLSLWLERQLPILGLTSNASEPIILHKFEQSLRRCASRNHSPVKPSPETRKQNPRWNHVHGQNETVVLRNATLFDGESFLSGPVDIIFSKGLISMVAPSSAATSISTSGQEYDFAGRYVTPGLVDMHSHHLSESWPSLKATAGDGNEIRSSFGPITPFLRIKESLKAYDQATKMIASGGITSSLIPPGSVNIMGGEGTVVKNLMKAGEFGEYVVEGMLLEHGMAPQDRHRYMKFACGENPKRIYEHTRMALAYILREHLTRAQELLEAQEIWCSAAPHLHGVIAKTRYIEEKGGYPEQLELESTIALLRGQAQMHNHCYEPQDFETILNVMHEFGVRITAFHHGIEAWQVPKMLKAYEENITIATFAEIALYKHESYNPNLYAGAILNSHGLPVAYKSDHSEESFNAKYLLSQAATAHAFHLPADKALQAVTSIPAKALDLDNRIGFVRKGYDADIVVWDSHPLSIGSTPQQVFIDGIATLDSKVVEESTGYSLESSAKRPSSMKPIMRTRKSRKDSDDFCLLARHKSQNFVVHGIKKSFLDHYSDFPASVSVSENGNLTMVVKNGTVSCIGASEICREEVIAVGNDAVTIGLQNGHMLPGLIAVTDSLGIKEIFSEPFTGNGAAQVKDVKNSASVDYAKYGVSLDGKAFARARLGGVTRAITAPEYPTVDDERAGLLRGVSVGIKTSGLNDITNGGIFHDDVGLHYSLGEGNKVFGSVSMAVKTLREILAENKGHGNASVYGLVADGLLPLIVEVDRAAYTQQVLSIKKDFPNVNIVINGGRGTPSIAEKLAAANISVILSGTRSGPATWETKDSLIGPPLTRSPASILSEAGVSYAISVAATVPVADSHIHALALEASWAAKYAGLNEHEAVRLVSRNLEDILGLKPVKDIVLWENNPLQLGASVVLSLEETDDGRLEVGTCWPDDSDESSL